MPERSGRRVPNGENGLDEGRVGERLWVVAEMGVRRRVHLLGVEPERACEVDERIEQRSGGCEVADGGEGLDEPEGAFLPCAFCAGEAIVARLVPIQQRPTRGEVSPNGIHGAAHAR